MTPKLKAKELVNRYKQVEIYDTNEPDFYCKIKDVTSFNYTAKQCALIAVNEVQQLIKDLSKSKYIFIYLMDEINYWNEVKQEIEKL